MDPAPPPVSSRPSLFAAAVGLLTIVAFLPGLQGSFLNWDDDTNFLENRNYRGLGSEQLKWLSLIHI